MKKLFLFLAITSLSFLSCSDDDEKNLDPIIGTWYLFSNGNTEVNDCSKKSTINFNENGNFTSTSFALVIDECKQDGTTSGTWKNKGNDIYTIFPTGNTIGNDSKLEFSNNNNTMKVVEDNQVWKRK